MAHPHDLTTLAYPRHVHLPAVEWPCPSRIVRTPDECAAALDEGYSLTPTILGPTLPAVPPSPERDQVESADPVPPPVVEPERKHKGWPKGKPRKAVTA